MGDLWGWTYWQHGSAHNSDAPHPSNHHVPETNMSLRSWNSEVEVVHGGELIQSQPDETNMVLNDTRNIHEHETNGEQEAAAVNSVQESITPQTSHQHLGNKRSRPSTVEPGTFENILKEKERLNDHVYRRREKLRPVKSFFLGMEIHKILQNPNNDFRIRWGQRSDVKRLAEIDGELQKIGNKCKEVIEGKSSIEVKPSDLENDLAQHRSTLGAVNTNVNQENDAVEELQDLVMDGKIGVKGFTEKLHPLSRWLYEDQARPEEDSVDGNDTVLDQTNDEQIGGEQTDYQIVDEAEEIVPVQRDQVDKTMLLEVPIPFGGAVQEDASKLDGSSSAVANHKDFNSASATLEGSTEHNASRVDFHGFQILGVHAEYLEQIHAREKEFWSTCQFNQKKIITFFLDSLGQALVIAQTPWASLLSENLKLMGELLDDVFRAGFKLDFLKEWRQLMENLANAEDHERKTKAELALIDEKMEELNSREKDIGRKKAELQVHGTQLKKRLDAIEEIRNNNLPPWDAFQKIF